MTDRAADDALTRAAHEAMPFARVLGVDVVEQGPERVVAMAAWAPERCTADGRLHGGYLMALADTVASLCAYLNRPPGAQGVTTIEAKTNFVGGSLSGTVTATAEPV